ncbi:DUF1450 domain-containing protein [Paenibacillus sp. GCM10012307]|uniref:DUF1450 domain-containing protein n=1 Tax=Paenibacillus roseus TaxID=2798579 RepID=A0A934IYL8_9BACL|nr:DUF1450 domain-containing protein [Paenibacillus roseus]MBJ6361622.1 DUF1450 domain-containing protein [Paenibacillus roseus]
MKKIKYCCKNLKFGTKPVYKAMKSKFPELKHKKKSCLGNCKMCGKEYFVQIGDSKVVCEPSAEKLYKRLRELIG